MQKALLCNPPFSYTPLLHVTDIERERKKKLARRLGPTQTNMILLEVIPEHPVTSNGKNLGRELLLPLTASLLLATSLCVIRIAFGAEARNRVSILLLHLEQEDTLPYEAFDVTVLPHEHIWSFCPFLRANSEALPTYLQKRCQVAIAKLVLII